MITRFFSRAGTAALIVSLTLLLLCLALPRLMLTRDSYRYIFVFDITQSMNVSDLEDADGVAQDRLGYAKRAVSGALERLPCGSEAGLALFTGHRTFLLFTPVEVCATIGELRSAVDGIDWRTAWAARSEVVKGLLKSIQLARGFDVATAVVFLSDGHESPPVHADFRQRYRGRLDDAPAGLIVGVGGDRPVPIPKLDRDNRLLGYWAADEVMQVDTFSLGRGGSSEQMVGVDAGDLEQRIAGGREHLSSLREDYLRELARETGFDYLRLRPAEQRGDPSAALLERLTGSLATPRAQPTDLRPPLALLALALLLSRYWRSLWHTFRRRAAV